MPSFYEKYGGAVLNATINKHFYTIYNEREDEKIQIISSDFQSLVTVDDFYSLRFGEGFDIPSAVIKHYRIYHGFDLFMASEIPPGSGLGSSGAVTVNMVRLCSHIKKEKLTSKQIAEDAYFIQRETLKLPIGKQDEYAAACGGVNFIEFSANKVTVTPITLDPEVKARLDEDLVLFFTGKTRQASEILQRQEDSAKADRQKTIDSMLRVKENAYLQREALQQGDLSRFGMLMDEAWQHKKKMSEGISNEFLDGIYGLARGNGALGGKITGAGGGGYFMFYCKKADQPQLRAVLEEKNLKFLDFRLSDSGVHILTDSNGGEVAP